MAFETIRPTQDPSEMIFADVLNDVDPFAGDFEDLLPPAASSAAIELSEADLKRFSYRFDMHLSAAERRMKRIHEEAKIDRMVYDMLDREQEYEGQPAITTPISTNKADGVLALIIDAVEQRPYGSFSAEGMGAPAEKATQVAPVCEAYLEREINKGQSREYLARSLVKETVQVGTGIAKLAMIEHPNGEYFAAVEDIIKLEHFYVDRIAVPNLKHTFCAFEFRRRYYTLEEQAAAGLLDPMQVEKLRTSGVSAPTKTLEENEAEWDETDAAFAEENKTHVLYEGYMRFRPEGSATSDLYKCVWSSQLRAPLAVRRNPVHEAYDHPPIALFRIGKKAKNLFGRGLMRRLNPVQQIADNAINNHLALNDLAASPPFLYRMHSPFGKHLTDPHKRIFPGQGIPTIGPTDSSDVQILQFPNPGLSLQDVEVAQAFADKGTYTEEAIGTSSGRKTLGQFRVEVQRGSMRLKLDMGDFAYDSAKALTMIWAMVNKYKIDQQGIVEIEETGKLLGDREYTKEEIEPILNEILNEMAANQEIGPMEIMEFQEEINKKLTMDSIPSAKRGDLTISLTGTKVIADKAAELDMLMELTPFITSLMEAAKQDSYINYHMRSVIEAMGFKDIEKRVPADPGRTIENPEERAALTGPFNEMMMRSSNMN